MKIVNSYLKYTQNIPERHVHMFTSNRVITSAGELVMGGGNALAIRKVFPNLPRAIARNYNTGSRLHTVVHGEGAIIALDTKDHFRDPSDPEFVRASLNEFHELALTYKTWTFHCPMPAVGLGGMSYDGVYEMVKDFPDNIIFYYV